MKKIILISCLLLSATWVFAHEVTDLLAEFTRRDSIEITQEERIIVRFLFLKSISKDQIKALEIYDVTNTSRFIVELRNGDLCSGDVAESRLICTNSMGLTTQSFQGDSD